MKTATAACQGVVIGVWLSLLLKAFHENSVGLAVAATLVICLQMVVIGRAAHAEGKS